MTAGVVASSRVRGGAWFADNFVGANGDPWNSSKWTITTASTSVVDIQGNRGRMVAQGANYTHARAIATLPSPVANVEILMKAERGSGEQYPHIYLRASEALSGGIPATAWVVWYDGNGTNRRLHLRRRVAGDQGEVSNSGAGSITFEDNVVWFRVQAVGTTCQAKAWPDGSSEPASWMVSGTRGDLSAAGGLWIENVNGNSAAARTLWVHEIEAIPL